MGVLPERCLVLEDSPAGIAAARAAGMAVVAVPDPNMDAALFSAADAVLASLHEFQPEAWGLPPLQPRADFARPDLEAASAS
jgi:pseudouridine-5'-monophosphatase